MWNFLEGSFSLPTHKIKILDIEGATASRKTELVNALTSYIGGHATPTDIQVDPWTPDPFSNVPAGELSVYHLEVAQGASLPSALYGLVLKNHRPSHPLLIVIDGVNNFNVIQQSVLLSRLEEAYEKLAPQERGSIKVILTNNPLARVGGHGAHLWPAHLDDLLTDWNKRLRQGAPTPIEFAAESVYF